MGRPLRPFSLLRRRNPLPHPSLPPTATFPSPLTSTRVSKPPSYGFSDDALISRRQILQAACETLLNPASRRDYNQGLAEDEHGTILNQVPWDKVPGALCVLQEAGETELVIQIGESLLRERLHKSFKQDVVLVLALAYLDMSRDEMALALPDFIRGCEVLGRALNLLQVLDREMLKIWTDRAVEIAQLG